VLQGHLAEMFAATDLGGSGGFRGVSEKHNRFWSNSIDRDGHKICNVYGYPAV